MQEINFLLKYTNMYEKGSPDGRIVVVPQSCCFLRPLWKWDDENERKCRKRVDSIVGGTGEENSTSARVDYGLRKISRSWPALGAVWSANGGRPSYDWTVEHPWGVMSPHPTDASPLNVRNNKRDELLVVGNVALYVEGLVTQPSE